MSKKIGTAVVGLLTALAMTLPGVTIANATEPKTETDKSPAAQEREVGVSFYEDVKM